MNRIQKCFNNKSGDILNIYLTAGFPLLESLPDAILALDKAGVDLVEVGMPYSDPLADGPTIQHSSQVALQNGMTLDLLFEQIAQVREKSAVPIILMGYFNQLLQYGPIRFFDRCASVGVDGLIIPDLPLEEYEEVYKKEMEKRSLGISFLITPQTPDARVRKVDELSSDFIYMVSRSSITGGQSAFGAEQVAYFKRIEELNLQSPRLIGFGISDHHAFSMACQYAKGGIVGSAFIRALAQGVDIECFVQQLRGVAALS